jgi:hypothetical protein
MAGLSPSGAASEVGDGCDCACDCGCDCEFLRENIISIHSGGSCRPALVAVGARPEIVLRSSAEPFK